MDKGVRHVSFLKEDANHPFTKAHIRTYLYHERYSYYATREPISIPVSKLFENYRRLRTLGLSWLDVKTLPPSIGNLIHLRNLDLRSNMLMEFLPDSITKLYNLQTLKLDRCVKLKELPKDLGKLVNLRVLGISSCGELTSLPLGMGKLTDLSTLSKFVVRMEDSSQTQDDELKSLKALKMIRGEMHIYIHFPSASGSSSGAVLPNKTI